MQGSAVRGEKRGVGTGEEIVYIYIYIYVYMYKGQWGVSLYPFKETDFYSGKIPREKQMYTQGRCVLLRLCHCNFWLDVSFRRSTCSEIIC